MENESFNQNLNNNINNMNLSNSNLDYDAITAELHSYYLKYKSSNNKKEMIKGLLHRTVSFFLMKDFTKVFSKLINNNFVEELIYLLENFDFPNKDDV